jgi:hypothetical protein
MERITTFLDILSWLLIFFSVWKLVIGSIGYYRLSNDDSFKMLAGVSAESQVPFSVFLTAFSQDLVTLLLCGVWLLTSV